MVHVHEWRAQCGRLTGSLALGTAVDALLRRPRLLLQRKRIGLKDAREDLRVHLATWNLALHYEGFQRVAIHVHVARSLEALKHRLVQDRPEAHLDASINSRGAHPTCLRPGCVLLQLAGKIGLDNLCRPRVHCTLPGPGRLREVQQRRQRALVQRQENVQRGGPLAAAYQLLYALAPTANLQGPDLLHPAGIERAAAATEDREGAVVGARVPCAIQGSASVVSERPPGHVLRVHWHELLLGFRHLRFRIFRRGRQLHNTEFAGSVEHSEHALVEGHNHLNRGVPSVLPQQRDPELLLHA
mmetsp:Transcript_1080/g.2924  ORF Transcript_1080/g.2924 Transcript_1080/m.2924 type:complete len:300 (-) Transcript_1080:1006-1905(-)